MHLACHQTHGTIMILNHSDIIPFEEEQKLLLLEITTVLDLQLFPVQITNTVILTLTDTLEIEMILMQFYIWGITSMNTKQVDIQLEL